MKSRVLVGKNLRRLRVAKKLTQEAVGLLADCEPSYVGRIERGRENPAVDLLDALAGALSVPVNSFFEPVKAGAPVPPNMPPGRKPLTAKSRKRKQASG